ncbi:hypothetical protein BC835DRAFT_1375069 [Cytidiella melzeri]|nr:hypothetical protein BC835DRAFT_1375069 [Cytidiella melzeri]
MAARLLVIRMGATSFATHLSEVGDLLEGEITLTCFSFDGLKPHRSVFLLSGLYSELSFQRLYQLSAATIVVRISHCRQPGFSMTSTYIGTPSGNLCISWVTSTSVVVLSSIHTRWTTKAGSVELPALVTLCTHKGKFLEKLARQLLEHGRVHLRGRDLAGKGLWWWIGELNVAVGDEGGWTSDRGQRLWAIGASII